MDRLDALSTFVTIADRGSFAAAAREHRVSPQAITRAVAALEARLGVQLFLRTTRSVRLTEEGSVFLDRCRQLLLDLNEAEQAVMGAAAEPQGPLVVTAPVVFGRMHVVPVIAELLRLHPRLSVRLVLIDRFAQLVDEGIDVAVRIGELADSALRAVRIGEVRRVLVASPTYLERRGAPTSPAELRHHDIIAFTGLSASDEWRFGPGGRKIVRVQPRLVVNGADAAIGAAVEGIGICRLLSYQVSRELAEGRLRTVLDADAPPPVPVNLVFQAARAGAPNVRAFIDQAAAHLRAVGL
jgi:DNA-binding transcriptional LysR family regulator